MAPLNQAIRMSSLGTPGEIGREEAVNLQDVPLSQVTQPMLVELYLGYPKPKPSRLVYYQFQTAVEPPPSIGLASGDQDSEPTNAKKKEWLPEEGVAKWCDLQTSRSPSQEKSKSHVTTVRAIYSKGHTKAKLTIRVE
jgi:hypothetical protein